MLADDAARNEGRCRGTIILTLLGATVALAAIVVLPTVVLPRSGWAPQGLLVLRAAPAAELAPGGILAQPFETTRGDLRGVQVGLGAGPDASGSVSLRLDAGSGQDGPLLLGHVPIDRLSLLTLVELRGASLQVPPGSPVTLVVQRSAGTGSLTVWAGGAGAAPLEPASLDGLPLSRTIRLRPIYGGYDVVPPVEVVRRVGTSWSLPWVSGVVLLLGVTWLVLLMGCATALVVRGLPLALPPAPTCSEWAWAGVAVALALFTLAMVRHVSGALVVS